jgi:O-antigen biosynthesis protein
VDLGSSFLKAPLTLRNISLEQLYNVEYYAKHCGTTPYERSEHWLAFFGNVADKIVQHLKPKTVFDAGCAHGFLVESLWNRGVHARGRDLSSFAISKVRSDIARFCEVGSIADKIEGTYDLVTCIEVVEHIPDAEALKAIANMTASTSTILFSSSPTDLTEPTHINVKPPIYWLMRFAEHGFAPDVLLDAGFLSPQAFVLRKSDEPINIRELQSFAQNIRLRMALIDREQRLGALKSELDTATVGGHIHQPSVASICATAPDGALLAIAQATADATRQLYAESQNISAQVAADEATRLKPTLTSVYTYEQWCAEKQMSPSTIALQRRMASSFVHNPLFSIVVPVYRVDVRLIDELIESVQAQTYPHWELCFAIADPARVDLRDRIVEGARLDSRIKYRELEENGGIARNSNSALELATGTWAVLLDHDDVLSVDALFEFARAINEDVNVDFIYSDKDQLNLEGTRRMYPLFKPQWSPEMMLNANYITHLSAFRVARARELGAWDPDTDGAQDWDIFLRVIGQGRRVKHVPKVLYHWRQAPTSVAAGGIAAKPYAIAGQLRAVSKHLAVSGWLGATADLDRADIHVNWSPSWKPSVSVVVVQPDETSSAALELAQRSGYDVYVASSDDLANSIDSAIGRATGEVIVVLDGRVSPTDNQAINELVGPLQNPEIGVVSGQTISSHGRIVDYGVIFQGGKSSPLFRGEPPEHFGIFGGASWYRNTLAASASCIAFRRTVWETAGGFSNGNPSLRADIEFCLRVTLRQMRRVMLNPYARFTTSAQSSFERQQQFPQLFGLVKAVHQNNDPYFHPELGIGGDGRIELAKARSIPIHVHDYNAEARGTTSNFDFTPALVKESKQRCAESPPRQLRSMAWYVPDFDNPFYGGLMTIFRVADYALRVHGITQTIVVVNGSDASVYAHHIGRAFPFLSQKANIIALPRPDEMPDLDVDAAIATLWVTAQNVLRLKNAHRKFHFLQDWEPLFYPAGTLSAMVEATYRFGFHAVANTRPLADSYKVYGGTADHFVPSIDTSVFNDHRPTVEPDAPTVIFCYARPGHPRNGFEVLMAAFKDLKARYGDKVDLVTAGSNWDPAEYGLDGVIRHLGLLAYPETGALYRAVDIGVVAMATRHPSYLPFELMACGALVVTNRNPYTSWLLEEGKNCLLFEMVRSDVVSVLAKAIDDVQLRRRLAAVGTERIAKEHSDWEQSCATAIHAFRQVVEKPLVSD